MKDSTKAIFDSSWRVFNGLIVETEDGVEIASVGSTTDAHRIARLPEMYDALMEAAYEHCRVCIYGHAKNARQMPKPDDMARNGCTLSDFPYCPNRNWWNLLKKVRDGK